MKVLIACEFSGIVRDEFIKRGHKAMSCDLLPTERSGPHYQGEVEDVLEDGWDLMLAFPPCTYLCSSGIHWNTRRPERMQQTREAVLFFFSLADAPIEKIVIENPVGIMSTHYRKPDQIIQPYEFGHDASKSTCLWLKGLPLLKPTKHVEPKLYCKVCGSPTTEAAGKYGCCGNGWRKIWGNQTPSGQNKLGPSPTRAKDRSRTFPGIAKAFAKQYG
jgi:hypothetical protein